MINLTDLQTIVLLAMLRQAQRRGERETAKHIRTELARRGVHRR